MKLPTIKELSALVRHVKPYIDDEYIAEDDTLPGIDLTVGFDPVTSGWDYQSGDNSYSGAAYFYPIWGTARVYRRSNSRELARELISQIDEQIVDED